MSPSPLPGLELLLPARDSRRCVHRRTLPDFLSRFRTDCPRPAPLAPPVQYTYDPLGRALTTTDPDGSVSSISYDDWTVTGIDAKGHQTRRTNDASGRLATVEEFNNGQTYTTTYQYDTLNNLTKVTDSKGNVTTIAYDSLGRKLAMDDPDMRHWTYAYDAVDNLTAQTDARGVATTFSYDPLNRLINKTYTIPNGLTGVTGQPVTYTYDGTNDTSKPFTKGKLTWKTGGKTGGVTGSARLTWSPSDAP